MSIVIRTEINNDQSNLGETLDPNFKMFEVSFNLLNDRSSESCYVIVHSHIIFPKCKKLAESQKDNNDNYVIDLNVIESETKVQIENKSFELFLKLLYGNEINVSYQELLAIYKIATTFEYSNTDKLELFIINNIETIPYSETDNQLHILMLILDDKSFSNSLILSKCKLSQLKRIKLMTIDIDLLRNIIDVILGKYTTDTKEIKTEFDKMNLKTIGKYETKLRKLEDDNSTLRKSQNNTKYI